MALRRCAVNKEMSCLSYPNCNGCGAYKNPSEDDREGSVESETTADVIADMYHRLIDRGFPSGTAEIIVYKMIDHGYFDKK